MEFLWPEAWNIKYAVVPHKGFHQIIKNMLHKNWRMIVKNNNKILRIANFTF